MEIDELKHELEERKEEIEDRLAQFRELREAEDERLFKELVFVILTSRSDSKTCWEATLRLDELGLLEKGSRKEIAGVIRKFGVQYEENKAGYIVENREKLSQPTLKDPSGRLKLGSRIDPGNLEKTREQLVDDLAGIGWKGASHFLRNVGYGNGFAILSGHVVKKMHQLGLLDDTQPPSGKEDYLATERKLQQLSEQLPANIQELDLVLWSMETGEVFK